MKEEYWEQFMVSGRVDDYLLYRAENVREQSCHAANRQKDMEGRGKCSESGNGYGDGAFRHSCR